MPWCTYLESFEKIHQCVFELRTVRKLNVTDGQTDRNRRTDGGHCNISRPRSYGAAGDNMRNACQLKVLTDRHTYRLTHHGYRFIGPN